MRIIVVVLLLGAGTFARGEVAAVPLRLADVLEQARDRNPEIRAARARAAAAAAVPGRVRALDDPTFSYEVWNAPNPVRVDRADNNILRLSQKVPFPGKRALAGEVAMREADMAGSESTSVELDVATAVKRAYYDLWAAHELLQVYSRERGLVERFARIAEQKYGVGEATQSDVLRAQVELTHFINRVSTQTLAIDGLRAELNALLSRPPDDPLGVPEDPPPPRLDSEAEHLIDLAVSSRPELRAQQAAVAREEAAVRLARRDYFPDFEFNVGRFVNPGQRDGFGAMAAVSIPLAYKWKYDAGLGEAGARLESAQAELRRIQDRVRREVKQAHVRAQTDILQWKLFINTHIPQAEQSLRVAESAYQTGGIDWLALIDTARTLESVHVEHIQAEADFAKAYADLERAVGRELPRGTEDGRQRMGPRE
jgi:cobalt-zinc-cadmium efflux system outer membrane protein